MAEDTKLFILSAEKFKKSEKYNPYVDRGIEYVFRSGFINSDKLELEADITDHYVEDNSAVQDHMALKPMRYTVRGIIGEKVFTPLEPYEYQVPSKNISKLATATGLLSALSPTLSSYMQTAVAAYNYVEDSYKRYAGTISNIKDFFSKNKTGRTINATSTKDVIKDSKQERALSEILMFQQKRTLVDIDSPYGYFSNFLIESAYIEQTDTIWKSELVVNMKKYRSVETLITDIDSKAYEDRYQQQMEAEQNLGNVQGKDAELTSTLYRWATGNKQ